ncbi:MAG: methyltransferase family protein [Cypionkella sp.]
MTASMTTISNSRLLEDRIGKFALLGIFSWQFYHASASVLSQLIHSDWSLEWLMRVVAHVSIFGFLSLVVYFTVTRKPPVEVALGVEARFSALLGTFLLLAMVAVPPAAISETQAIVATLMIITGTLSSIWCISWLGRNFSVMAAARELVSTGPYAIVRHPLYLAEAISVAGVIAINGSALALALGAVQCAFQFRRMRHEEQVLSRAFPSYAAYSQTTPMIIPRLFAKSGARDV